MSSPFDPNEMVLRFRERADAVKRRGFPPVEGPERQRFIEAANLDFQDFAMLVVAGCAWFIGFLMTHWLIARFYSTLLPAFVTLQAFGLLRAVERILKPPGPRRSWAKVFTAVREVSGWLR